MPKSIIAYDRDLPGIPGNRPWERPTSFLVKDSTADDSDSLRHQHRFIAKTAPHIPNPPLFTVDHDAERLK